jgi:O-succinylbenzoic acid--CoA ligase
MNIINSIRPSEVKIVPGTVAIVQDKKEITYVELYSLANKTANFLRQKGINENDIVTLLFNNSPEFIVTVLALWEIGAIPVPLNTRLLERDLNEQITFLTSKFTIKSKEFENLNTRSKSILIPFENLSGAEQSKTSKFTNDKTALMLFTSGTSGKPKAVMLSFENLTESASIGNKILNQTNNDRWLASLPFYHIGGFSMITRAVMFGTSIVIPGSLSTDDLAESIMQYHPTLISLVSNQLKNFIDINLTPPEELRTVLVGGGFFDPALILEAIDKGWKIAKVYGSTETSSFVSIMNTEEVKEKPGASGRAILPNQIFILSDNRELSSGKSGEIIVKSPAVMKGYFKEETGTQPKNGLYQTGDIGYLDEEGFLFVETRRNDLIISGGENINPFEIESAILTHTGIKEACVVGVEDYTWGQIACTAIILKENVNFTRDTIENYLGDKLAHYKIPKRIIFIDELPKSELGKVIREDVKKLFY